MDKTLKSLLKFYRNLPIRRKLLLILYIQIIIPLIFIGYVSYKNSEDIIRKKSTDYAQDILQMIELRLEDCVGNLSTISQDLLNNKKIYDILSNEAADDDPLKGYEQENEINNILKTIVLSRNEVQSICIVSSSGKYYPADDNSRNVSIKSILPYERVLERAREGKGRVVWYLDAADRRVNRIYLARTINNWDNFNEIGLLVILVNKEFIETIYQGLTASMQNIAVISPDNELIVSRNPDDGYLLSIDSESFFRNGRESKIDKSINALVSYVSLKATDWKIVAYVPLKELYRDADILRERIILFCVLSVLILSILNLYIAFDFINPIKRLVEGMKKVQKGESGVYIEDDRGDELGFLNKTFNEMSKEINHLVTWVYQEQITRKEAEIKALQSQINPHFLFNTLESINWMAQLNNVPEISETVTDLSKLMEASIGRDDRLISVSEEFSYIDRYVSLLKRRFEGKIHLIRNVQAEASEVKIPRLLIQPLVENAVHHGIEKSREKGIISLNASMDGSMLTIEVLDNGPGIDKEELDQINERLAMDNDTYFRTISGTKRKSIGIENVNRRIKLFYGEEYGLKIESETGSYTRVVVAIPVIAERGRESYYV